MKHARDVWWNQQQQVGEPREVLMSFIQFKRRITEPAGRDLDLREAVRAAERVPTPVEDIDDDAFARAIEEGRRHEAPFARSA